MEDEDLDRQRIDNQSVILLADRLTEMNTIQEFPELDQASAQSAVTSLVTEIENLEHVFELTILNEFAAQEAVSVLSFPNQNGEIEPIDRHPLAIRRENGEVEPENGEDLQYLAHVKPCVPVMVLPFVPVVSE